MPFTRYLVGPYDYTTMVSTERRRDSSWAHQVACVATFQSPIPTISARSQSVLDNSALDILKGIQPVWNETIGLPGPKIGELSIFARRSGIMWRLVVLSPRPARTIEVPLSFLGDGSYQGLLIQDNKENDAAVVLDSKTVWRDDTLTIDLISGGGFIGRFTK